MKVLVTGGAGYVGSVVSAHLLAEGWEVTVLDKLVYGGEGLLGLFGNPCFRLIAGDVRDPDTLRSALDGASAVVHLAAVVGEAACAVDPESASSINFEGTRQTLAAAQRSALNRFLFVSTCSNYGISAPDLLVDETFPLKPLSQYAESKVRAEKLVLESPDLVCGSVLRFGTICGLSPRMRFDLLVSEMARAGALGEHLRIFTPNAWRPFLHIRDAARAIAHCLSASRQSLRGNVFNVVGENYQKRGLVQLVRKHYPATPLEVAETAPDLRDYRVSAERIRQELGFTPQYAVEDAFLETASAVASGLFRDPHWAGHSAVPLEPSRLRESSVESPGRGQRATLHRIV
jgi:nucleoside-diphosphate-sugar epimerase